jgi:hypothetical protein
MVGMVSCNPEDVRKEQSIYFEEIPPQLLSNGGVQLNAAASSGLPVEFVSESPAIASIEGSRAVFHAAGNIRIYAVQRGNDSFFEAPDVFQSLLIRDWDINKENQTIEFALPASWQLSVDGTILTLNAIASSGLPVRFTLSGGPNPGFISSSGNILFLYHGGEISAFPDKYDTTITIVASQDGNPEYNPADNVAQMMRIIGDVLH